MTTMRKLIHHEGHGSTMLTTGYELDVRSFSYPEPSCPEPVVSPAEPCLRGKNLICIRAR